VSAIRNEVLHPEHGSDCDAPLPRTVAFKSEGLCFRKVDLQVVFPPVALDAHRGVATVWRLDSSELLAEIPVPEITGYKSATHSIEALGPIHRFSRNGRHQVLYGDWFTADGHGRELAAAMVAGLVVRIGLESPNGLGGASPVYALTPAGQAWVIQQPKLREMFDHYNRISEYTAWLTGSDGTVPFDTRTGAVLGLYGEDPALAPLYVEISRCAEPIVAGEKFDTLCLAYRTAGGHCELPAEDYVEELRREAVIPGM
jgi:hypothetical protein